MKGVIVTPSDIKIVDSYLYPKKKFTRTLGKIEAENEDCLVFNRSYCSMELEWAAHNLAYTLGLWKERTKDVDLNYPQPWYVSVFYFIFGGISWIFIK